CHLESGAPRSGQGGRPGNRAWPAKTLRHHHPLPPDARPGVARRLAVPRALGGARANHRRPVGTGPTDRRARGVPIPERLNRYLARAGVAPGRAAVVLIAWGAVRVNGGAPPASGLLIEPDADRVTVDGQPIEPLKLHHHYLALHKPTGLLVTA